MARKNRNFGRIHRQRAIRWLDYIALKMRAIQEMLGKWPNHSELDYREAMNAASELGLEDLRNWMKMTGFAYAYGMTGPKMLSKTFENEGGKWSARDLFRVRKGEVLVHTDLGNLELRLAKQMLDGFMDKNPTLKDLAPYVPPYKFTSKRKR